MFYAYLIQKKREWLQFNQSRRVFVCVPWNNNDIERKKIEFIKSVDAFIDGYFDNFAVLLIQFSLLRFGLVGMCAEPKYFIKSELELSDFREIHFMMRLSSQLIMCLVLSFQCHLDFDPCKSVYLPPTRRNSTSVCDAWFQTVCVCEWYALNYVNKRPKLIVI